jgi:uncharacterized protein
VRNCYVMQPPPPPGWYPDPTGAQRWWDGAQWGPAAPVASEAESGKTLATLAHLGILAGSFPLPLIIRLTEGRKNAFVKHHATEALNFQITFMIFWLGLFAVLSAATPSHTSHLSAGQAVLFACLPLAFLGNFVLSILGCVRASQQLWWRYPVSIRFVRGARSRSE